ncbi:helix-turn-helix domain-containing protein [Streptococcus panodentis]|uniref:AraC family transcriptional regulator n=1 Tax=Streptococcus panodentis TaxID=1581472 RepID=A0ABS5ATW6_9STRE|nr:MULTISPECIES: AraC family transcriptional regulator [Streptococcus]KXT85830.1 Transcriptional regulator, AraC family [Streptococcus sp. DD11]MBP2620020.1 AraC family transcriptional regulator [Streptococcus panodentis]
MNVDFDGFLNSQQYSLLENCQRFSSHGKTYFTSNDEAEGFYWNYETDYFRINIHDSFIKKDSFLTMDLRQHKDFLAFSSYFKSANGECLSPYKALRSKSSFIVLNQGQQLRFLLNGQSYFQTVEIDFKESMIEDYLMGQFQLNQGEINRIFTESHKFNAEKLGKIAEEILHYHVSSIGSELFYEIKAKEWLSVIINDYYNHQEGSSTLNAADDLALSNVSSYIDDHYASDIPQELLSKIAMMSKTKLKNTFKLKYKMTMTEYTQRRRMAAAEQLLGSTHLEIKDVAMSVGYQSHSRFSALFKKYTGIYPHEVKRHHNHTGRSKCDKCQQLKKPSQNG